jgi:5-methyltetrahydrofolate--homocysteine methyltransferase
MNSKADLFRELAASRIMLTDGAFGTIIQGYRLDEAAYRGPYDTGFDQKGNNDLLVLTQPGIIAEITRAYLAAGSDIVSTNTFNANRISQADYGAEHLVREMNLAAARIAREAADAAATPDKPRFVAGAVGPTNKTLSLSPDVNDPGFRAIGFDELKDVYREQIDALLEGGCDFILIETIFDTLNAKAGIMAAIEAGEARGAPVPLMISMTITDMSGRNLSGHSVEAFWAAVRHARPLTIGLNCSFGAPQLRPHVATLSHLADTLLMVYPNAGLPNDLGQYDEQPETTGGFIEGWAGEGLINVVGGCCGTTPEHIAAMAAAVAGKAPRKPAPAPERMTLAGLDPFVMAA